MDSPRSRLRHWHGLIAVWMVSVTLGGAAESLESLQKTVTDLSRLRTETARFESEWRWQRQTLDATLQAWKLQAEGLDQKKTVLAARTEAQRGEVAGLRAQAEAGRTRLQEADQQLRAISDELITLRASLPSRLSKALELPYRSLADPTLAPGDRMQHLTNIWARCTQFNGAITCNTETLVLEADEHPRLLDVIYWGLSHGFALDRVRQVAYVGRPEKEGWKWREEPGITGTVVKLIAIYRDEMDPEFVPVPVQATDPLAGPGK